jgi:hypothetical protein
MAIKNQEKGQFKKGTSGNPNGRPKKFVSLMADEGYSKSEVTDCIQVMMAMTFDELKDVFKAPEATVLEKSLAMAIRKGIEKGNLQTIESLLDRVYGRPKQEIETKVTKIKPPRIRFRSKDEAAEEEEE